MREAYPAFCVFGRLVLEGPVGSREIDDTHVNSYPWNRVRVLVLVILPCARPSPDPAHGPPSFVRFHRFTSSYQNVGKKSTTMATKAKTSEAKVPVLKGQEGTCLYALQEHMFFRDQRYIPNICISQRKIRCSSTSRG